MVISRIQKTVSFDLFKTGKDLAAIARERKLSPGTIAGHLVYFVEAGKIKIDELVSKEKQKIINDAVVLHGSTSLKTILDNLPDGFNYGELRMVLAAQKSMAS